jgi:hypothetical protein
VYGEYMCICRYITGALILITVLTSTSVALNAMENTNKSDKMILNLSNDGNTVTILRDGQTVVVYQKNTLKGKRSIANAITELYAINHTDNLMSDSSAIVPPQSVVWVKDEMIPDDCQNAPCKDPNNCACDYFAHNNVSLHVIKNKGDYVQFMVDAKSAQHDNNATPINYTTEMTITVPYNPEYVVIEYDVTTTLNQKMYLGLSIRPLPFFEIVKNTYNNIAFSNSSCLVETQTIENNSIFINNSAICLNQIPWAAMYDCEAGNLGMILQSWNWSSGEPRLYSSAEKDKKPNLYFQSSEINHTFYESGKWEGKIIFIAYGSQGYMPIKQYAENISKNLSVTTRTGNLSTQNML